MNRIAPCDKRRWFQVHCCRSVVKASPMAQPDIAMAFGVVLTGALFVLALGLMFHLSAVTATASGLSMAHVALTTKDLEGLKSQIIEAMTPLKAAIDEQQKKTGAISEANAKQFEAMQKQLDGIDVKLADRHAATQPEDTVIDFLRKHEGLAKVMRDKSGSCVLSLDGKQARQLLEQKTTITTGSGGTVGSSTSGVMPIDRLPGITPEARQTLQVRDVLTSRPTTMQIIDFVKVNAKPAIGSPQTEASDKGENAVTFTSKSERVQTVATWIPASRQALDDMDELMAYLQNALPYYVNLEEEKQLLKGSGTGTDLDGLITQATAYDTTLTPAVGGWNRIDILGRVIQQIVAANELDPTFVVLNPADFWAIRLTKDSYGRYILGDPQESVITAMNGGQLISSKKWFGLTPISTGNIASGTFLVGSGNPIACEIRDRMEMQVEIATQHSDYFTKNLIAIRAEKRLALIVRRAASFITGTFTTSPSGS